ncbi:universal stress protein [Emcibacter sp.]|uniref:universal stress protein n=1 Tax=Emcibacter sp. TaxID=1979954 RepID=UPI002AA93DF6|nr:universal stress protein [Emcibacter sp.]
MKKILVIAEQLPDSPSLALDKALYFSDHGGATIHVLSVVYNNAFDHPELITAEEAQTLQDKVMSQAKANLNKLLAGRKNATGEIQWGKSLVGAVEETCEGTNYDLIIKTGHRSESFLHQPSDFRLLNLPKVPVMILSAERWRSKPVVMATIDFSSDDAEQMALNDKVLSSAKEYADLMEADLHCCYVVTYNSALADLDIVNREEIFERFKEKRLKKLQDYAAGYGIPAQNVDIKPGKIEKVIPSMANRLKAELVVLGTHRRKGLSRIILGNSSEKILKILRTDILAVKPD